MSKAKRAPKGKGLITAVLVIAVIAIIVTGINFLSVKHLLKTGSSYNKVEIENQLTPQKDENGNWSFTTDRDFKIMHLTDIHIGGGFMSKTVDEKALNAVALMVTKEKPDLVIATIRGL